MEWFAHPALAGRGPPAFFNDRIPRTTDTPHRGVSVSVRDWNSDKVRLCPILSLSVRLTGVHGSFVGNPNQFIPDADAVHGNQIFHGAAERLVGAVLGPCR